MNREIKLFKKLYIDDKTIFTMGEKDFFNAIKLSNINLSSIERYAIFKEIMIYLINKEEIK